MSKRNRYACLGEFEDKFDANETAFLEKQLQYVETTVYNVLYSKLKSKEWVPFDGSLPSWAKTWTYRTWSKAGMAQLISNYADDLPRVDVFVEETELPTVRYGAAYGYNIDELEASARLQTPLDTMRAETAREVLDRQTDAYVALGETKKGIKGFLNNTNVPELTVTNGNWDDETDPLKIAADMFEIENKVIDQSGEWHEPDTMLLPPLYYDKIPSMPMSATAPNYTVAKYFLENSKSVKTLGRWNKLNTVGTGGVPMVLCYKKDPSIVKFMFAYDFEQMEPEKRNLEYVVDCYNKLGGTNWYRPLGGVRAIGINT